MKLLEKSHIKSVNSKIIFAGITRNSSSYIEDSIARVRELGSMFATYQIMVYENDSEDNTTLLLQKMRVPFISEKMQYPQYTYTDTSEEAISRMAYYRNRLKERVDVESGDYVCVIDFDVESISWDGFFSCFQDKNWDCITSLGLINKDNSVKYYDYFAHRDIGQVEVNPDIAFRKFVGDSPIKVHSAFGGAAIYKKHVYTAGVYSGEECEHVTFHRTLINQGHDKIYLNPKFEIMHR